MSWCLRHTYSTPLFCRQALSWRSARVFCTIWFTLTSIGFPLSLPSIGKSNCAVNPGQQCRCSLAKRMSGTCCCGRESKPQPVKSCCSAVWSAPKSSPPSAAACCSKKLTAQSVSAKTTQVQLSISPCDCGSESPTSISLNQEPRLLATATVTPSPEVAVASVAILVERVESALLQPPVPPPKIVL